MTGLRFRVATPYPFVTFPLKLRIIGSPSRSTNTTPTPHCFCKSAQADEKKRVGGVFVRAVCAKQRLKGRIPVLSGFQIALIFAKAMPLYSSSQERSPVLILVS